MRHAISHLTTLAAATIVALAGTAAAAEASQPAMRFGNVSVGPVPAGWLGIVPVPVFMTAVGAYGADLVFRVDTMYAEPAVPFISWHAFADDAGTMTD